MTKRLQKSALVTVLVVLCLLLATSVLCFGVTAQASAEEGEQNPAATYHIGVAGENDTDSNIYYYATQSEGWTAAVAKAKEVYNNADGNYVKVILDADWLGAKNSSAGFGSGSDSFYSGEIYVPASTRITIDLNGKKIDRNLSEYKYDGRALHIYGELTVDDSSDSGDGKITGGYNSAGSGGGIRIRPSGKLVLKNGSVTGNKAYTTDATKNIFGGGVCCEGTFEMYGGSITNNGVTNVKSNYGGGICVSGGGTFNMYGGTISGNTAVTGGGLCLYTYSGNGTPSANLKGGTFENNKAIAGTGGAASANIGGGAICVYYDANLSIENCKINDNFAENNGGGIYFYAGRGNGDTLTIKDCELNNNVVVSTTGNACGGAIAAVRQNGAAAAMTVEIDGNDAVIENNRAIVIGSGEKRYSYGCGIEIWGCTLNLKSGTIMGNSGGKYTGNAYQCTGEVSDDVKAIDDWLKALGPDKKTGVTENAGVYGGGIDVARLSNTTYYGTLNMSGGIVKGNSASYGAGLYNNAAIFNLSGGTVTENYSSGGGGGMYSTANGTITLSGTPVMTGNDPYNMHLNDGIILEIAGLSEGAEIGITALTTPTNEDKRVFTRGYSADGNKYFKSDRDDHYIFCNEKGELVYSSYQAKWEYDKEPIDLEAKHVTIDTEPFDTRIITYNGKQVTFSKDGVVVANGVITAGGVYTATADVDTEKAPGLQTSFKVIVDRLDLVYEGIGKNLFAMTVDSAGEECDEFLKTGNATTPAVSVYVQFSDGTRFYPSYDLSYEDNKDVSKEVGEAKAIISIAASDSTSGIEIKLSFTIVKPITEAEYTVKWQYNAGSAWKDFSATDEPDFTYNGIDDFSERIRAELSYKNYNTVYVNKNSRPDDGLGFALEILEIDEFKMINAGTYTVKVSVASDSDCTIAGADDDKKIEVVVKKLDLKNLGADNFIDTDSEKRPLWLVDGNEYLLSKISYNEGNVVKTGTESNYYVRYTAKEHTIALNDSYIVGGYSIQRLQELGATIKYDDASAEGAVNTLHQIKTSVTITFTNNFANVDTITFTKDWAIVTINNGFLDQSGEVYSVSGFTYGESATMDAPRPEHGDVVRVTIPAASEFDPDLINVEIRYVTGGYELYVGGTKTDGTLAEYVTSINLKAGTYTMVVSYDGDEEENYFEIERSYQFVVAKRELLTSDIVFDSSDREYNGTELRPSVAQASGSGATFDFEYRNNINVGEATVIVTGKENYTGTLLFHFEITAGSNDWKNFKVTGWAYGAFNDDCINIAPEHGDVVYSVKDKNGQLIGNLALADAGTYTLIATVAASRNYSGLQRSETFVISKAANGWTVLPSIIEWKYSDFDINTNVVLGTPYFGTPTFKIQDADGNDLTDEFALIDGLVPDSVKDVLAKLHYGNYKLVAAVEASDNYWEKTDTVPFTVDQGANDWTETLDIISWSYGNYSKDTNRILGSVMHGTVTYAVTKDGAAVRGLESFTEVNEDIAKVLKGLDYGSYALHATVTVDNNYTGLASQSVTFTVAQAPNDWQVSPNVIAWQYGEFNSDLNLVLAKVTFGRILVKFTDDKDVAITDEFELAESGKVPEAVANVLKGLSKGEYKLVVRVQVDDSNYSDIRDIQPVTFSVNRAVNAWEQTLGISTWIEGGFNAEENRIEVKAKFGDVIVKVTAVDDLENVYYEGANGTDELASILAGLEIGNYNLSVAVVGTDDYNGINDFIVFRVFPKPGLPWWGALLITLGALLLAAAIIFVLWKKGVFQILTGKIVLAIRTRASVDATIASVRAAKMMEAGRQSVADAKRRERFEELQKRAKEQRAMSPEERATQLEAKAQAEAEKADKIRARSEQMQARADKLRGKAVTSQESTDFEAVEEVAIAEDSETQTEE